MSRNSKIDLQIGTQYLLNNGTIALCTSLIDPKRGFDKRYPFFLEGGTEFHKWYHRSSKTGKPYIGGDTTRFLTELEAWGLQVHAEWDNDQDLREKLENDFKEKHAKDNAWGFLLAD